MSVEARPRQQTPTHACSGQSIHRGQFSTDVWCRRSWSVVSPLVLGLNEWANTDSGNSISMRSSRRQQQRHGYRRCSREGASTLPAVPIRILIFAYVFDMLSAATQIDRETRSQCHWAVYTAAQGLQRAREIDLDSTSLIAARLVLVQWETSRSD